MVAIRRLRPIHVIPRISEVQSFVASEFSEAQRLASGAAKGGRGSLYHPPFADLLPPGSGTVCDITFCEVDGPHVHYGTESPDRWQQEHQDWGQTLEGGGLLDRDLTPSWWWRTERHEERPEAQSILRHVGRHAAELGEVRVGIAYWYWFDGASAGSIAARMSRPDDGYVVTAKQVERHVQAIRRAFRACRACSEGRP